MLEQYEKQFQQGGARASTKTTKAVVVELAMVVGGVVRREVNGEQVE